MHSTNKKRDPVPVVGVPSLLRDLTNGQKSLSVEGETIQRLIENLEDQYPGIKERLCDGDRLRPSISVIVDGYTSTMKLGQRLHESSEVHFVISISGGKS